MKQITFKYSNREVENYCMEVMTRTIRQHVIDYWAGHKISTSTHSDNTVHRIIIPDTEGDIKVNIITPDVLWESCVRFVHQHRDMIDDSPVCQSIISLRPEVMSKFDLDNLMQYTVGI